MPSPRDTRLDSLLRPHGWTGRVLVTGWFSLLDDEVTAGDTLAQRAVSASLDRLGIVRDTACREPGIRPSRTEPGGGSPAVL